MINNKAIIGISLGLVICLAGCNKEGYKAAIKAKDQLGEYNHAIGLLESLLEEEKYQSTEKQADLNYHIAESYRLSNRMTEALPYYKKAMENGKKDDMTLWHVAYGMKLHQEYDEAAKILKKLKRSEDKKLARRAYNELKHLDEVKHWIHPHRNISVEPVDGFNTPQSDYAPLIKGREAYFTSTRRQEAEYTANGGGYDDIYVIGINGMEVQGNATLVEGVNLDGRHDAYPSFSKNGKTMVFARSSLKKEKEPFEINIYLSELVDDAWSEPEPAPFNSEYWDGTPFYARDGSIYFASNRPFEYPGAVKQGRRSYGGLDIFKAYKHRRTGKWVVRNLGRKINTPGNEMFPNISPKGVLHFASDGQPGLGGLDIFKSTKTGSIITVTNMGAPINSSYDDFGLSMVDSADGFFTSNRKGGKGSDDIYKFHIDPPKNIIVRYWLAGIAYSINQLSGDTSKLGNVQLVLTDKNDTPLDSIKSEKDGEFDFEHPIEIDKEYKIYAEKPDVEGQMVLFSTIGKGVNVRALLEEENDITFEKDVYLSFNPFVPVTGGGGGKTANPELELMILYDVDDSEIRPDAAVILDKVVAFLLRHPHLKVELGSHTDDRGTKTYNHDLSQRRANSAVNYLIEHGISRSRLEAKGYGEEDLKHRGLKNRPEDEPLHQENRRTTIRKID